MIQRLNILGLHINHISFNEALRRVSELAFNHKPSYVCFANSHMIIEANNDDGFARVVNNATMVLADGMPVASAFSFLYNKKQQRIAGMDFMPRLLSSLNNADTFRPRIFFYGSTEEVLGALVETVKNKYQNLFVAGAISPPFQVVSEKELENNIASINKARPHFVFIALGCPKQEKWMAENSRKINAVLLGVGGAFVTTAGLQKRAPYFMQKLSLEWLYRLGHEPRRLFKRYLVSNSLFIYLLVRSILKKLFYGKV